VASNSDSDTTAVSSQGDTLTISSAGSNLAANATSTSSDSDSSSSEDNLSQYTEIQLQQMLQNGEITQAEYDAEIQSRESSDASSVITAAE
jgi:predicted kinase